MNAAAVRHLQAADGLNVGHRRDVAGYLYGIAAECALKAMMIDAGMRPSADKRNDPFYQHFPALKNSLLDAMHGRQSQMLGRFASNPAFMSQWEIKMRYCKGGEIKPEWVTAWSIQARDIVGAIGT